MRVVTVSGTCSEVGKTTLACALLARLPGWAAVKVTRGHYRSCGRDPETCCVSHLLGDAPRVFADRETTGAAGKDTGRYWEAGAAAVRWVVGARGQEVEGLRTALADLTAFAGVLVEGNRIAAACDPELAILVTHPDQKEIKATARRIVDRMDGFYVPDQAAARNSAGEPALLVGRPSGSLHVPVWGPDDLEPLAALARG